MTTLKVVTRARRPQGSGSPSRLCSCGFVAANDLRAAAAAAAFLSEVPAAGLLLAGLKSEQRPWERRRCPAAFLQFCSFSKESRKLDSLWHFNLLSVDKKNLKPKYKQPNSPEVLKSCPNKQRLISKDTFFKGRQKFIHIKLIPHHKRPSRFLWIIINGNYLVLIPFSRQCCLSHFIEGGKIWKLQWNTDAAPNKAICHVFYQVL